ncbi:MAG: hypothetical protein P1P78_13350 [Methyloprofundus sp.]|nr:hypothetical protein [Methyloprofundus sp.]
MHTLTIAVQDQVLQQVLAVLQRFEKNEVVVLEDQTLVSYEEYQKQYPDVSEETYLQAVAMDQSGFAKTILNSPEEERWNDL